MLKFILSLLLIIPIIGMHPIQMEKAEAKHNQKVQSVQASIDGKPTIAPLREDAGNKQPALQLAVISDVHITTIGKTSTNKFVTALQDLKTIAPEYDAMAVVGDMTDHGLITEYDLFRSILKENGNPNASNFMVMGNHEWMEKKVNRSSKVTDEQLMQRFKDKMGVPGIYYDQWIQGYHFITIAGEKSETSMKALYKNETDADWAYISEEQFQWLEKTLPIHAENSKPIFVFFHQPITGTIYGSEWGAGLDDQKILALLKKYPQVILFTGHSHYPLNDPTNIIQDGITMVNTGAIAYTYTRGTGKNKIQSQGYLVNVFKNRVEFNAREFSDGSWIKTVSVPLYQK